MVGGPSPVDEDGVPDVQPRGAGRLVVGLFVDEHHQIVAQAHNLLLGVAERAGGLRLYDGRAFQIGVDGGQIDASRGIAQGEGEVLRQPLLEQLLDVRADLLAVGHAVQVGRPYGAEPMGERAGSRFHVRQCEFFLIHGHNGTGRHRHGDMRLRRRAPGIEDTGLSTKPGRPAAGLHMPDAADLVAGAILLVATCGARRWHGGSNSWHVHAVSGSLHESVDRPCVTVDASPIIPLRRIMPHVRQSGVRVVFKIFAGLHVGERGDLEVFDQLHAAAITVRDDMNVRRAVFGRAGERPPVRLDALDVLVVVLDRVVQRVETGLGRPFRLW